MAENEDVWEITCSRCGGEGTVPFEPAEDSAVYCRDCFREVRREERRREESSPRKKHNTRVSFQITCSECGEEAELDYVPRGVDLDEVMCEECFRRESESIRWRQVQDRKERERKSEWTFECAECGRTDVLNFEPEPDRDYRCARCFYDQAEPDPERVESKERVGRGVYIRRDEEDD
ncbi:MAG: CxxC-x17-CxxC domain-containing protein [Bradymonadaceae bacterium]